MKGFCRGLEKFPSVFQLARMARPFYRLHTIPLCVSVRLL